MKLPIFQSRLEALIKWVHSFNPYQPEALTAPGGLMPPPLEAPGGKSKALRVFLVFFALFVAWAVFAPIDAGVVLNGVVVVQGNRKAVQHPSGGVVESILVEEGDRVKQGDVLFKLNPLTIQANLAGAEIDYIAALVTESRLQAEREGLAAIKWVDDLAPFGEDARVVSAKAAQQSLFAARKAEFQGQQGVLAQQIAGLKAQTKGQEESVVARRQQMELLSEEIRSNRALADEGHVPRAKVSELERTKADATVSITTMLADLGKNKTAIAATELQLTQTKATWLKDLDTQFAEAQKNHQSLKAKVESLRYDLALTEMKAPVSGVVVGLKANTVGGVIQGGQTQMEIVPQDGALIVEADVPTNMIDKVHAGLLADLRFSAFNMVTTPVVPGKVKLIGADKQPAQPPVHQNDYYLAQVETTAEGLKLLDGKTIQPGMPVEVVVKTGERSFLSYLLKPMADRFARSFKEGN